MAWALARPAPWTLPHHLLAGNLQQTGSLGDSARESAGFPLPILTHPEEATLGTLQPGAVTGGSYRLSTRCPRRTGHLPELPGGKNWSRPKRLTCQREAKHVSCHIDGGSPLQCTGPGAMARAVLSCCHDVIGDDVFPAPGSDHA